MTALLAILTLAFMLKRWFADGEGWWELACILCGLLPATVSSFFWWSRKALDPSSSVAGGLAAIFAWHLSVGAVYYLWPNPWDTLRHAYILPYAMGAIFFGRAISGRFESLLASHVCWIVLALTMLSLRPDIPIHAFPLAAEAVCTLWIAWRIYQRRNGNQNQGR